MAESIPASSTSRRSWSSPRERAYPISSGGYVEALEGWLRQAGRIGTVGGRYYAMDRDKRWDRVQLAYDAIVGARGESASGAQAAIAAAYERGETDEFIRPTVIGDYDGMADGDVVIHFNFRPDRGRELVRALGEPGFDAFERDPAPEVEVTTLARFREGWPYPVAFPPSPPETTLARVLSQAGARQLHVAETEKYAHVTYFFNGGHEAEWEGEERHLVPSPRDVATYDEKPAMSAAEAADAFCSSWEPDPPRFGIINFANPDMVGHTGSVPAATAAVEAVDAALARVVEAVHAGGGACIVTADHGNCEQMIEPDGSPNTAHSTNPVPVIVTVQGAAIHEGILADVAPTVLALLGIEQPAEMTGKALVEA
jgi:2,3-bisphosphoglycerate-independent phosphoglycerate mutase